ncbi:hypothetical protein [Corynebacterium zhongnanshanii]|nr:hypothetical protein [Corynebacterium zhongnanshanii]
MLFEDLGVKGATKEVKRAAVEEWLKDNEPVPVLLWDLEDAGYINT